MVAILHLGNNGRKTIRPGGGDQKQRAYAHPGNNIVFKPEIYWLQFAQTAHWWDLFKVRDLPLELRG